MKCKFIGQIFLCFSFHDATAPRGSGPPHGRGFTFTLRHKTLGRTPLDEWLFRRRDIYLKTHIIYKIQTSMTPGGIRTQTPSSERRPNHTLDPAAIWIGNNYLFFFLWRWGPARAMASSFLMRFLGHTQRRTTVGRTPLDEWSALCRDLYLTTHNTHNRKTSMLQAGFEPTISAGERPQTYALDRAANGTGDNYLHGLYYGLHLNTS